MAKPVTRRVLRGAMALAGAMVAAAPAAAADETFEVWLNPGVSVDLGGGTGAEFESWQRFRDGDDTHGYRLWLNQKIAKGVTGYAGIERRAEGDSRETRYLQQLSYPLGPLKGRTRLEERDFDGADRLGWRLRQRVGGSVPLTADKEGWAGFANVEGFFTLRATSAAGQTGLTGVRTIVGVEREWERVELQLGYLRQQNIRDNRPDTIAHAPYLALTLKL